MAKESSCHRSNCPDKKISSSFIVILSELELYHLKAGFLKRFLCNIDGSLDGVRHRQELRVRDNSNFNFRLVFGNGIEHILVESLWAGEWVVQVGSWRALDSEELDAVSH